MVPRISVLLGTLHMLFRDTELFSAHAWIRRKETMTLRSVAITIFLTILPPSQGISLLDLSYKGGVIFGREESITTFASLATSAVLPSAFTICSSTTSSSSVSSQALFQLVSQDDQPWMAVWLDRRNGGDEVTLLIHQMTQGRLMPPTCACIPGQV